MANEIRAQHERFLPQFSKAMLERLEDKGHNVAWLANEVGATYEHMRKVGKGIAFPSRRLLKDICRVLGLKENDMWRLVISDKLRDKYGEIPTELAGKSERMLMMERVIEKLTPEQFEMLHGMAEGLVNQNRRRGK